MPQNYKTAAKTRSRKLLSNDEPLPDWTSSPPAPIDRDVEIEYYKETRDGRKKWNDEVKEYAYHVWAYVTNHNAVRTQMFIRNPPREGDRLHQIADFELLPALDIDVNTIRFWASLKGDDWNTRVAHDFRMAAPDLWSATIRNLAVAANKGSEYFVRIFDGLEEANRDLVQAAEIAFDRVGLRPWTEVRVTEAPRGPKKEGSTNLQDATPQELMARLNTLADALTGNSKELTQGDADVIDVAGTTP